MKAPTSRDGASIQTPFDKPTQFYALWIFASLAEILTIIMAVHDPDGLVSIVLSGSTLLSSALGTQLRKGF